MSFKLTGDQESSVPRQRISALMSVDEEVAIIGAGPYGLLAAAHLLAKGIGVRVFGKPMAFWAEKMPEGMLLRSPRVASNIADPTDTHTLESYETSFGKPPNAPVPLETLVNYGRWFSKPLVNSLDTREVVSIRQESKRFVVTLGDGETIWVSRVDFPGFCGHIFKEFSRRLQMPPD